MPIVRLLPSAIVAQTGFTGTVANIQTLDGVSILGNTGSGHTVRIAKDSPPLDYGTGNALTIGVVARTNITATRTKSLRVEFLDVNGTVLESFVAANLTTAWTTTTTSFAPGLTRQQLSDVNIRCVVQEQGGMADSARVEIDFVYLDVDYNVAVAPVTITGSGGGIASGQTATGAGSAFSVITGAGEGTQAAQSGSGAGSVEGEPAGSSVNPTTIMGANAISYGDAVQGGIFQDAAGTIPAAVGDPVGFLPDLVDGAYTQAIAASKPTLRGTGADAYLEFRNDILFRALSRSGPVWFGVRFRRDGLPSSNTRAVVSLDGGGGAWFDTAAMLYTFRNIGDFYTYSAAAQFSGGDSPGSIIPDLTYTNIHAFVTATERGHLINGDASNPKVGSSNGNVTSTRAAIGGAFGSGDDFKGPYDIQRFYILDREPTAGELASLTDWLENGDSGGGPAEITGSGAATNAAQSASGAGLRSVTASGTGAQAAQVGAGFAVRLIIGAGEGTVSAQTGAGVGTSAAETAGSGTSVASAQVGAGDGSVSRLIQAIGAGIASAQTAIGAGVRSISGEGAGQSTEQAAVGAGLRVITGAGDAQNTAQDATGTGARGVTASGGGTVSAQRGEGTAAPISTGSGAGIAAGQTATGVALRIIAGGGAGEASAQTGTGAGASAGEAIGTGSGVASPQVSSGIGAIDGAIIGAGSGTVAAQYASGAGVRSVDLTGAGISAAQIASGSGNVSGEAAGSGAGITSSQTATGAGNVIPVVFGAGNGTATTQQASGNGLRLVIASGAGVVTAQIGRGTQAALSARRFAQSGAGGGGGNRATMQQARNTATPVNTGANRANKA